MSAKNISGDEALLLDRWRRGDERSLKTLIEYHQRCVYSFSLNLACVHPDTAYEIAVESFVEAIRKLPEKNSFLVHLLRLAIEKCREKKEASFPGLTDFSDLPVQKRELLRITKEALNDLRFEDKALLLLRDQAHLGFHEISQILEIPVHEIRPRTIQARVQLRDKVEEILKQAREGL